ncbi:hypothetical protein [Stenotrophomonas sp. 24(2023)]|uniref:hypothetical protein n=1 Tax=Stenotrophomonas sp. 24(2023) TaxID=3068324 RepID=UPI0027DF57BD|nr:hypothetical protein [Stenotrophomonas sp. 24(2023)]WMJ67631.1 hypothetical protein Q9R17_10370 [Stenotrophomonas sp. 24(2023)]
MDIQHGLAVGFLEILHLQLVLPTHVLKLGTRGILHAALAVLGPAFDCSRGRSNCRLVAATAVLPWMISKTSTNLRRAVQRLILSSMISLIFVFFRENNT